MQLAQWTRENMIAAISENFDITPAIINSVVMFLCVVAAVLIGSRPLGLALRRRERRYGRILRETLLLGVSPRAVTVLTGLAMIFFGFMGFMLLEGSLLATLLGAALGVALPEAVIKLLCKRRRKRLDAQLVSGIQTLCSGVRAGLNLVQSMRMIADDGPEPISQEFAHLLREYDYGTGLDDAMSNAARRVDSADYKLLFAALQTHRQRGGDLGETLDRIAASIREIQRLENRVEALTAQGRATARWLGAMPAVVMTILYFVDPAGVSQLFTDALGKAILVAVVGLNVIGFLWIRKIVAIDI